MSYQPTTLSGWKMKAERMEKQKRYAWGKYYEEMEERFTNSFNQVQRVEIEIVKETIPEHIKVMLKDLIKEAKKDITCPVCLDQIDGTDDMKVSNCGHFLCKECYDELKQRARNGLVKCPECRTRM